MRGNSWGKLFSVTTFGESHGEAYGVILDGIPAGITFSLDDLKKELTKRAPGRLNVHTSRKETDEPEILSGIFEGKTLGSPIGIIVRNQNQKSSDYDQLKNEARVGHADHTTLLKYGVRDHRGGGRASGRETLCRVIGGYFASLVVPQVSAYAYITHLGPYRLGHHPANHQVDRGELYFPDQKTTSEIIPFLIEAKNNGESWGGIIRLSLHHVPTGLGEPVFDKLKADLAKAVMSIGGCLGVSLAQGFDLALMPGTELVKNASHFQGMGGGISDGRPIELDIAFKAPSTVGEKAKEGRHDPCLLPRVVPVVEAMAKMVIADHYLRQKAYLI